MMNSIIQLVLLVRVSGFSAVPDLEVISIETHDPANMFKEFATSNHPWAVKFREFATKAFGIDFSGPPPPLNENIVDWKQSI